MMRTMIGWVREDDSALGREKLDGQTKTRMLGEPMMLTCVLEHVLVMDPALEPEFAEFMDWSIAEILSHVQVYSDLNQFHASQHIFRSTFHSISSAHVFVDVNSSSSSMRAFRSPLVYPEVLTVPERWQVHFGERVGRRKGAARIQWQADPPR